MKIAVIIPTTSNKQIWNNYTDSFLLNSIKCFIKTASANFEYKIFVGYDHDDQFYCDNKNKYIEEINSQTYHDFILTIDFIPLTVKKGHLTKMWNILANEAIEWGAEYLYQCGDDIQYSCKGWIESCVNILKNHNNIGLTGPKNINGNTHILTQSFVHKNHVIKLGYYFPEEIQNWFCDNWINLLYKFNNSIYYIPDIYYCINSGGEERYNIIHCQKLAIYLAKRDSQKIFKDKIFMRLTI